jgi:hypothetical protein
LHQAIDAEGEHGWDEQDHADHSTHGKIWC